MSHPGAPSPTLLHTGVSSGKTTNNTPSASPKKRKNRGKGKGKSKTSPKSKSVGPRRQSAEDSVELQQLQIENYALLKEKEFLVLVLDDIGESFTRTATARQSDERRECRILRQYRTSLEAGDTETCATLTQEARLRLQMTREKADKLEELLVELRDMYSR